ncbi:hypothetical protein ACJ72_02692 [Emergomyces africanus]|uniref:RBR-type E3 ubiquitin transferase n=1 Tax=Emergomyces africanus TaxID=1955775 RepID=A0A1B7P1Q1_9EURO|nr:hypothetical protein ACJ72_02692 [Emergomyces africanus]
MTSGAKARESPRRDPPKRSATQRAVADSWVKRYNQSPTSLSLLLGEQYGWQRAKKPPKPPAPKDMSGKRSSPKEQGNRSCSSKKATSCSVAERTVSCLTCSDDIPVSKAAKLACSHSMCEDCLRRIFTLSVTDPQHMPPRCCTSDHIPLKHVDRLFDRKFKIKWNKKYQEYTTKNRLYCPTKYCGQWIKPSNIRVDTSGGATGGRRYGICGSCRTKVCGLCNGKWHKGSECPKDDETRRFVQAARENGWQRCYNCSAMVELREGCNHMTCRCRAEFCIICAARWKTCACPWFNNNGNVQAPQPQAGVMREQVAQVQVPRDVPRDAPYYVQMPDDYEVNPYQPPFQPIGLQNAMPFGYNVAGAFNIAPFEDAGNGMPPYHYNPFYYIVY